VEDADAALGAVAVDAPEPLFHAPEEGHFAARLLERFAAQRQPFRPGALDHAGHVGEDHVGVLLLGQRIGLGPELLVALAHRGDEVVFLHVARGQRAVEVVDQRYGETVFVVHGDEVLISQK